MFLLFATTQLFKLFHIPVATIVSTTVISAELVTEDGIPLQTVDGNSLIIGMY